MFNFARQTAVSIALNRFSNLVLIGFIFACLFAYVYFANTAVRTLALLEDTKEESQSLGVKVSELESERFDIDNKVDSSLASSLGFVEVHRPIYLMKSGESTVLSLSR